MPERIDLPPRLIEINQDYDQRNPLFFEKRDEWEYGFDLEVTKTDFFLFDQFSPFVKVGSSRRDSSIDAFFYNEYRFNIEIRKTF